MPQRIAIWNPARDVWEDEKGGTSLFCGHSDVFSGTFPGSGMTRNGVAYELRTWERRMGDTGYSSSPDDETDALLRTPCAAEDEGGPLHPDVAKERGQTLRLTGQILAMTGDLLPTPQANIADNGGSQNPVKRRAGGHSVSIQDVAEHELMPTPSVADVTGGRKARSGARSDELLLNGLAAQQLFGRFAPAIRRWENVLGRSAPAPTERTGRKSGARLSPRFVEWMMGLPAGWVTDPEIGITRSQQLKALGNGVVPQQGAAAISDMLTTYERQDTTA